MANVIVLDAGQVYRRLVAQADTLRPDDRTHLLAMLPLMQPEGGNALAQAVRDYYRDADRADRTPRQVMYMHLGTLCAQLGAK
jgi:hypothetical protein